MKPTTISEMTTAMRAFADEADVVDASDISHEDKLTRLTELSKVYGLE